MKKNDQGRDAVSPPRREVLAEWAERTEAQLRVVPTASELHDHVEALCQTLGLGSMTEQHVPAEGHFVVGKTVRARSPRGIYGRLVHALTKRAALAGTALANRTALSSVQVTGITMFFFLETTWCILAESWLWAAACLALSGAVEAVDAVPAKLSPHPRRAVFIDYMSDRITDLALFGSIAIAFSWTNRLVTVFAAAALIVSSLSSYARAQGEALRFQTDSGFGRLERLVVLFLGLLATGIADLLGHSTTYFMVAATLGTLVIACITLMQRVMRVWRTTPYVEINGTWDDESFLPRLIEGMATRDRPVTVITRDIARGEAMNRQEILVDRTPNGHVRVRYFDAAG